MTDLNMHPLEAILTWCAEAAPNPWYPSAFSQASGIPQANLDPHLDVLRLGGLIRLTDWVQGRGQGYTLTPEGELVVKNPRLMDKVRTSGVAAKAAAPVPARAGIDTSHWDRGEKVRGALLNPVRPVVTFAIFFANVLVFLAGAALVIQQQKPLHKYVVGSDPQTLDAIGAVNYSEVLEGEWWRLLTSCFVHVGALHIAANMYALYVFGPLVERLFGHWRYLLLYLIAGFGGGCTGVLFQLGCAGASGAICGLLGAFAAWTFLNRRFLPPPLVASWMRNALINTVLIIMVSAMPGISWSGHLGGAVLGILAAMLLNYQMTGIGMRRWLALLAALLLPVACYAVLSQGQYFSKAYADAAARHSNPAELADFNKRVFPRTGTAFAEGIAEAVAMPLVGEAVERRNPQRVRSAITVLNKTIKSLREEAEIVSATGPYRSNLVQSIRLALLDLLEKEIALFQLYRRCLESGKSWTEEEKAQLVKQEERVKEASRYWRSFLRSS